MYSTVSVRIGVSSCVGPSYSRPTGSPEVAGLFCGAGFLSSLDDGYISISTPPDPSYISKLTYGPGINNMLINLTGLNHY